MEEYRITPNVGSNRFGNRHFASLKVQANAIPGGNLYRATPAILFDSWYEDASPGGVGEYGYCGVRVHLYSLFSGVEDLDRTMPLVSGVIRMPVDHRHG